MNSMKDYYNILGVKHDASFENIRRAYDRERFEEGRYFNRELDEAYYVLSDYDKRKEYDKKREKVKNNIYSDSSYTTSSFSSVEQEPPVVEQEPPVVEQEPPVVEQEPPVVEQEPPVVEQEPPVVEQEPLVVEPEISQDNNFITEFSLVNKDNKKGMSKAKHIGSVIAGFAALGPIGAFAVHYWLKKHRKTKLVKDARSKKITKILTEEMKAIEKYNETLDKEINQLLSRPYNNYKLQINKKKYELQIELLTNLLNIRKNNIPKKNLLKYRLNIISIKMQLESAKKNLENVKKKISQYEGKQILTNLNNNLININMNLAAEPQKNSIKIHNLKIKQSATLNLRNIVAKNTKARVIRLGSFYDKIVKVKDFVKSFGYITKNDEELDNFINSGSQRIR